MSKRERRHCNGGEPYRLRKGAGWKQSPLSSLVRRIWPYLRRNRNAARGGLIFSSLMSAFTLVYVYMEGTPVMDVLRAATARATGFLLDSLGANVQVVDIWVSSPDFTMGIVTACTGIVPTAIVISAVIAYPSTKRQKGEGIAMAVMGIYAINLIRMVSLFLVGSYLPQLFDTAHYIIWQSLIILLGIGLWFIWVETRVNAGRH